MENNNSSDDIFGSNSIEYNAMSVKGFNDIEIVNAEQTLSIFQSEINKQFNTSIGSSCDMFVPLDLSNGITPYEEEWNYCLHTGIRKLWIQCYIATRFNH